MTSSRRRAPDRWSARPVLAAALRGAILVVPVVLSVLAAMGVGRLLGGPDVLPAALWWIAVLVTAVGTLLVIDALARRLLPLAVLLRLSMLFPDRAPSRYRVARRAGSIGALQRQLARARELDAAAPPDEAAEVIITLVTALSVHDRRTRGHSERVHLYADMLGEELGLDEGERERLRWAAMLHDIGKLHVDADLLNKDGAPDEDEWAHIRRHPTVGRELIAPLVGWLGEWADAVDQHHERYDGTGYPRGLAGKGISRAARIVAVADAYEVMTAPRPYKLPVGPVRAREELAACAGTQFDPDIVRAFLNISLGRLRRFAWPAALVAIPPLASRSAVGPAAPASVAGTASAASVAVLAVALVAPTGLLAPPAGPAPIVPAVPRDVAVVAEEPVAAALPAPAAVAGAPETEVLGLVVEDGWQQRSAPPSPPRVVVPPRADASPPEPTDDGTSGTQGREVAATDDPSAGGPVAGEPVAGRRVPPGDGGASPSAGGGTSAPPATGPGRQPAPAPGRTPGDGDGPGGGSDRGPGPGGGGPAEEEPGTPGRPSDDAPAPGDERPEGRAAPKGVDDTAVTTAGSPLVIDVLANDEFLDLQRAVLVVLVRPAQGHAEVTRDLLVRYRPREGFTGTDRFRYRVCHVGGGCGTATVTVDVTP